MTDAARLAPELELSVETACLEWRRTCPDCERLASEAAETALLRGLAQRRIAPVSPVVLGLILTDDAEQRRLNRQHRGQDASTNVLAFSAADAAAPLPPGAPLLLGDVVLAFETVRREAAEQRKPFSHHLRHLVAHGTLHLLGYDHESATEAAAMESLECEILALLGVPDPYGDTM